jgi:hypothetical protein
MKTISKKQKTQEDSRKEILNPTGLIRRTTLLQMLIRKDFMN